MSIIEEEEEERALLQGQGPKWKLFLCASEFIVLAVCISAVQWGPPFCQLPTNNPTPIGRYHF